MELNFVIYLKIDIFIYIRFRKSFDVSRQLYAIYKTEGNLLKGLKLVLILVWSIGKKFLK